jgi:hypothetical protein
MAQLEHHLGHDRDDQHDETDPRCDEADAEQQIDQCITGLEAAAEVTEPPAYASHGPRPRSRHPVHWGGMTEPVQCCADQQERCGDRQPQQCRDGDEAGTG